MLCQSLISIVGWRWVEVEELFQARLKYPSGYTSAMRVFHLRDVHEPINYSISHLSYTFRFSDGLERY